MSASTASTPPGRRPGGELTSSVAARPWKILTSRARKRRWSSVLPRADAAELLAHRLHPLVRRTRRHLPPDLLAAVLDALIATWAPRQPGARDLRLLVEGRGEAAEDLHFAGPVVRIGSADSCHLKLDATDTAAEACELRRTESGWSVRPLTEEGFTLNGEPLQLKIDTPLSVQDQLEIGPVVCTIEAGDPPASMMPRLQIQELLAVARGNPMTALGTDADRWSAVRVGDWEGFLSLPEPWIHAAYRSLGYEPPAEPPAWHSPVDSSLTGFALRQIAARVAERCGTEVEAGVPQLASAFEGLVSGRSGWLAARIGIELDRLRLSGLVVWPAAWAQERAGRDHRPVLFGVPLTARVIGGRARLSLHELRRLEQGDVLIPDAWMPRPQRGGGLAGAVELHLQRWRRPGRLVLTDAGARIDVADASWSAMDEENESQSETPAETPEIPATSPLEEELELLLSFEIDRIAVPLKDLASWEEGTTVALDRTPDGAVRILLHHGRGVRVVGHGRVVVVEGKLGIQLERWNPAAVEPQEP